MKKLLLLAVVASFIVIGCSTPKPKRFYNGLEKVCIDGGICSFVDRNEFKRLMR